MADKYEVWQVQDQDDNGKTIRHKIKLLETFTERLPACQFARSKDSLIHVEVLHNDLTWICFRYGPRRP